jgi:hypothetical protein
MNSDTSIVTLSVAVYVGLALAQFFSSITRDLVTPVIVGIFPGAEKSLDKIIITVGSIKLNVGEAIASTLNLLLAFFVVNMTLPYIRAYVPVAGRR